MSERDSYRCCELCPRRCGADRTAGHLGVCGAGEEMLVSRVALHFWEEPPLSGEAGSGTVFFAHCALGCVYCQNRAISRCDVEVGKAMTAGELAEACLDLQRQGAMNINFVTPTHYAPSVRTAVVEARASGLDLPVVWNTSGYETVRAVRANQGVVDVYLTDFKYADAGLAKALSGTGDYPETALAALDAMVEAVGEPAFDDFGGVERMTRGVIVRHLLLPGCTDDSLHVVELLHRRYGGAVRLSLMNQYTPVLASAARRGDEAAAGVLANHSQLGTRVPDEDYERVLDFADALGVEDYFWQAGGACEESFIPDFE